MKINTIGVMMAVLATSYGCAVQPTVSYSLVKRGDANIPELQDRYCFQKSAIMVNVKTDAENSPKGIEFISKPEEFCEITVGMLPGSDPAGVTSRVAVAKTDNTELPKEIGLEVKDERIQLIKDVAGLATSVIGLGFLSDDNEEIPTRIDTLAELKSRKIEVDGGTAQKGGVTLVFGMLPPDALPITDFPENRSVSVYAYAACRTVLVSAKVGGKEYQQQLKISDPRYFQQVAFPVKGKITSHSACGVSVTTEKDTGVSSNAAVITAIIDGVKTVKDAQEKAEEAAAKAQAAAK